MAREIQTRSAQNAGQVTAPTALSNTPTFDDFKTRLIKLIPSEILTAYVTIQGLISGAQVLNATGNADTQRMLLWIVFVILLLLNPVYLYFVSNVRKWPQIVYTTIAFFIWILVIGGPVNEILHLPAQFIGSILLVIYTLLIPIIYKG